MGFVLCTGVELTKCCLWRHRILDRVPFSRQRSLDTEDRQSCGSGYLWLTWLQSSISHKRLYDAKLKISFTCSDQFRQQCWWESALLCQLTTHKGRVMRKLLSCSSTLIVLRWPHAIVQKNKQLSEPSITFGWKAIPSPTHVAFQSTGPDPATRRENALHEQNYLFKNNSVPSRVTRHLSLIYFAGRFWPHSLPKKNRLSNIDDAGRTYFWNKHKKFQKFRMTYVAI